MLMETPSDVTVLKENEIFVFGSNESGKHGAGAARFAHKNFGAEYGVGHGFTGRCYAIPTKNRKIQTLRLSIIRIYVLNFIMKSMQYPELKFLVTPVATGLAGYTPEQIAPMFIDAIDCKNIYLPRSFWLVIYNIIGGKSYD